MEDSVLVTILLVIVSVLLIIDIIIAVTIWQILRKVKHVTDRAERVADNVQTASQFAKNMSVPTAITSIIKATADQFGSKTKNR